MLVAIVASTIALVIAMIFGSFTYTWSESKDQQREKSEWRKEHQEVLDKRFQEAREAQKEISKTVYESNHKNDEQLALLRQLLEEQRALDTKIDKHQRSR